MFVFIAKTDRDGTYQPTLCIASRRNERLVHFDEEEVAEIRRVGTKLKEILELYEKKSVVNRITSDEEERWKLAAGDSIGVEL